MQSTEEKKGRVGESKHIKSHIGQITSQWLKEHIWISVGAAGGCGLFGASARDVSCTCTPMDPVAGGLCRMFTQFLRL